MSAPFSLPKLPYSQDALAPIISAQTLSFHYGKHHNTYVTNLNNLVTSKPYADMSLEEVIKKSFTVDSDRPIFNNAAQVWNHNFYWDSLTPKSMEPSSKLKDLIKDSFGNFENFKKEFSQAAVSQFGSGWAWLIYENGKLKITKTSNAETPLTTNAKALLTIDVWEHAYYLDYQNRRADYVNAVIDKLLNWEFAQKNLDL